ncbi:MAG: hypothetical protein AAF721_34605 [Myxococcota bacterium]
MHRNARWAPLGALALFASSLGCSFLFDPISHKVMPLDGNACNGAAPTVVRSLPVYWSWEAQPERPHQRLARLEVEGESGVSLEQLLSELQSKAAACGATALLAVEREYGVSVQSHFLSDDETISQTTVVSGTAVRFGGTELHRNPTSNHEVFGWDE